MMTKKTPLVRARVIHAALHLVKGAGEDVGELAGRYGLSAQTLWDPEALLPVPQCNAMLSEASDMLGDPYLGATVGRHWATSVGAPFESAKLKAQNLGHLLTLLAIEFETEATSGKCELRVDANKATFIGRRAYSPGPLATFGAAAFTSFIVSLIKQSSNELWDAKQVSVLAPIKDAIPETLLPKRSVSLGSGSVFQFTFPAEWLGCECRLATARAKTTAVLGSKIDPDFVGLIKSYLDVHIPDGDLSIDSAARAFSFSIREFQNRLQINGTSFRKLLLEQKMEFAKQCLRDPKASIKSLAEQLGYNKTGNFSRAFHAFTGHTPSAFQQSQTKID